MKNKKFYVLENEGMSINPFYLSSVQAKDFDDAYEKAEQEICTNTGAIWVIDEGQFKHLKELIKNA